MRQTISRLAVLGMMFTASPPLMTPMETMAVLSGSTLRATICWAFTMNCARARMASWPFCGWEPWAFWPVTETL